MSVKTDTQVCSQYKEKIKWFMVIILLTIAIIGNYYYIDLNVFLRVFMVIFFIIVSGIIALMTNKGKIIILFAHEARIEIRKVIWPTYQETLYTTFIVAIVTVIMSLILWGLDGILVRIISFITNLRF
ncbi:Protein translocase subunit SecE [Serratia symbiotica]|nr:Protein translocase subunit SecE [Serratia symbiotica]